MLNFYVNVICYWWQKFVSKFKRHEDTVFYKQKIALNSKISKRRWGKFKRRWEKIQKTLRKMKLRARFPGKKMHLGETFNFLS